MNHPERGQVVEIPASGTPVLDIKPYLPLFDCHPNAASGWMNTSPEDIAQKRSDNRFLDSRPPQGARAH